MNRGPRKSWRIGLVVLLATPVVALAQGTAPREEGIKVSQLNEARCRKDVRDYLEAMRLVRTTAGQIGEKVATGLVSEDLVTNISTTQGPCAAAQLLRERRMTRSCPCR